MELSKQEQFLIATLRDLKPFERIEIIKDASGRPNTFLVRREQKIMVSEINIIAVK